ncbi:MAG: hypothetical protein WCB05_23030 [Candidatus Sulfotelmatobacter sp.]
MKTQAWGWLTVAVLAAGLNASYHDGGLEWAHRIANRVEYNTTAVLALATGNADRFFTEARMVAPREENSSCRLTSALARVQSKVARSDAEFDRFVAISDRQEAQIEASRDRMEAQLARVRIPAAFSSVVVRVPKVACPRVRVNVPQIPQIKMPMMPVVHIDSPGAGPV